MEKKVWYSSPLKFFWNELYKTQKKFTPEFSDDQIFSILRHNIIRSPLGPGENTEKRELVLTGLELWRQDAIGEFLHIFFLEKHLRDFLEKTPLSDLDSIRDYLYENGKDKKIIYFITKNLTNCVNYAFGLHIPYETNGYAFSLNIFEDNTIELYFSHGKKSGAVSDKLYKDLIKKDDQKSLAISKMFRLAINTIAYMKCFPDCVSEGVPKITYSRDEERSDSNITFQMSEKITDFEESPNSKIPHFRKGFFRVLRSDYFTHKKGQTVFVTETMVKGRAKTITTSEQLDEFENNTENESKE